MKIDKTQHFFMASLVFHIILGGIIFVKLNFSKNELALGESQSILSTYMYPEIAMKNSVSQNKSLKQIHNQNKEAIALLPRHAAEHEESSHLMHAPSSEGNGKPIPAIIAILHSAIQEHQHYPESALQMQREGKTLLIFTLYPDGMVKNIQIANSSGTDILDQAAVAAIHDALPFKGVSRYISNPEKYQIAVSFELNELI